MSMALYFHILNTEVFEYSFILVLLFLFLFLFLFFLVFFYSITFFFSYTTITPVIMWIIVFVGYYTIILVCQILSYLLRLLLSFSSYFSFFFSILVSIIFWYISIIFLLILSHLSTPLLSSLIWRRKLGKAVKSSMKQVVVAVLDADGAYGWFKKIVAFTFLPIDDEVQ